MTHKPIYGQCPSENSVAEDSRPGAGKPHHKPTVSDMMLAKWQRIVDLMSKTLEVRAALIVKLDPPQMEILAASTARGNPYRAGLRTNLGSKLYCEQVMKERQPLLVRNALAEPQWCGSPQLALGMIFYLGFPVLWPDGLVFGTICVMDDKQNASAIRHQDLILQFKEMVEDDLVLLMETSERKRAEEALKESEQKYRLLVENANDVILIAQDGMLKFVNAKGVELSGYPVEELTAKPFIELVHPDDREIVMRHHIRRLNGKEQPGVYEFRTVNKNGEIRWSRNSGVIITWEGRPATLNLMADITETRMREIKLNETEQLLSKTFDSLQDLLIVVDQDLRVMKSNWKGPDYVQKKDREGHPYCYAAIMNRETPCDPCHALDVFATGKARTIEHLNPVDGKIREIQALPICDEGGKVIMVVEHLRDVTKYKQTEEALSERERMLRAILDASPVGIALVKNRVIHWANRSLHSILGYKEGALVESSTLGLFPDSHEYDRVGAELYPMIQEKGFAQLEIQFITKDGHPIRCDLRAKALDVFDPSKGIIIAAMDLTERKRAEARIDTLAHQLLNAQEEERRMISRELHDRLAQDLSSLKIGVDTLFDGCADPAPESRHRIMALSQSLQDTILAVRDLSYELRPPALNDLGLVQTVFHYCMDFQEKTGVQVDFFSAGIDEKRLDPDAQINLYRMVQEALNNIKKHAEAGNAVVRMVACSPHLILRIEDDGKGFDVTKRLALLTNERRMGLRSIEERVKHLKGKMTLRSAPGRGTRVLVELPLREELS
jgi:PAS domain S-box-containing protein